MWHWEWLIEPLAMDFANTTKREGARDVERLRGPADLADWARCEPEEVPLLDEWAAGPGAPRQFPAVLAFRDDLKRFLWAVLDGEPPPAGAVERINAAARAVPVAPQLVDGRAVHEPVAAAPALDGLLALVAASAIGIAAGDVPLGFCDAPSCGQFFEPSRRNQHWCSDACGTRARVARHAARHAR